MKYKIINKLNKNQIKELHNLYKKEWWTSKRELKDIKKMLKHTDIIIAIKKDKELIAFVRVLSDFVYKAEIYDLIVDKKYRGKKLGKTLIKQVLKHKKLKTVEHFSLQCKGDMVSYYKKLGFSKKLGDLFYLRYTKKS